MREDNAFPIKIGQGIHTVLLKRGQMIFGRNKAEEELSISGSKIYRSLRKFDNWGMLKIQANSHYSVITVCNFDSYQKPTDPKRTTRVLPVNSQRTASEQPVNTIDKENKENKKNPSVFSNFLKAFGTDKKHIVRKFTLNQKKSVVWHLLEPLGYTKQEAATYWETIHDRNYVNPDGDPYTMEMIYKEVKYYHSRGWIKREAKDD
jgi:hypothetical protein